MGMKISEAASLAGVSVRTLHHYDQIGVLVPSETTETGYRLYSEENLETLQQIIFFKELGFPLKKIREILNNPSFNRYEALLLQKNMLVEKRNRAERMIRLIDKTIQHTKGEINMTNEEKFEGIHFHDDRYEQEARERFGDEAIDETNQKLGKLSSRKQQELSDHWEAMFQRMAGLTAQAPDSREVQAAIKEWYTFLNQHFGKYTPEAFAGLGRLYIEDERFTQNIDQYKEGLAQFMSEAMTVFSQKKE